MQKDADLSEMLERLEWHHHVEGGIGGRDGPGVSAAARVGAGPWETVAVIDIDGWADRTLGLGRWGGSSGVNT